MKSNITVMGTSHIAKESVLAVEHHIATEKPDIVAVELDANRVAALFVKKKERFSPGLIFEIGLKGYLFLVLGHWIEKKLGDVVGVTPGSEMKKAVKLAKKHKLQLALIDQNIQITLRRFSQAFTWREKGRILVDLWNGLILRKKEFDIDIRKVPAKKVIEMMIKRVQKRYPSLYKVLIEERNEVMINNIRKLRSKYPDKKIFVVVGAGHEQAIVDSLNTPQYSFSFSTQVG